MLHSGVIPFHCTKCDYRGDYRSYQKYKVGPIVHTTDYIKGVVETLSWYVCEYSRICKKLFVAVLCENNRKEPFQFSGCYYNAQCKFLIVLYIKKNLFLFFECELFTSERDLEHLHKAWSS